jgi:AsmA protein
LAFALLKAASPHERIRVDDRPRQPEGAIVKRWTIVLFVFIGLVIVALASIPFFVNANTFRPVIERQLTTTLGRRVRIGDLSLSLFSGSLVAKDLSVSDNPRFSAAPFLTARELRIGVLLRPLIFSRQINLRSFEIESPQITVIRAADGTWNFSDIGPAASPTAPASRIDESSAVELSQQRVDRIVIDHGRAVIASLPAQGQPIVYEHVNFTARDFSFDSPFPFELNAELPADGTIRVNGQVGPINRSDVATSHAQAQISVKHLDPVASGFLDPNADISFVANIDMDAESDGQTLVTSGVAQLQDLRLRKGARAAAKSLEVTYSGTHRLKDNSGQIEDASARVDGAEIHVNGAYQTAALGANDPVLNLKLVGQGLPIDELQSLMSAAGLRLPDGSMLKGGSLSMNLGITGPAKSLVITGPVALDNTRLVGFDLGSKIHGIAALSGLKTGDTTEFKMLRAYVRITNARVVADKIYAVIPAVGEVSGSGRVLATDQLDFDLAVKVASAKGVRRMGTLLLTKLNGSGRTSENVSGVPIRVTGTPGDPYITADVGAIVEKKFKSLGSMFVKRK